MDKKARKKAYKEIARQKRREKKAKEETPQIIIPIPQRPSLIIDSRYAELVQRINEAT